MITIIPILGIGEVEPGADLAHIMLDALSHNGMELQGGDILVVTQKIVSKAENRFVSLGTIEPSLRAQAVGELTEKDPRLVELVLREASEILRAARGVLIARHRLGFVMANAGVDRSNTGSACSDRVLLLPENPDASAEGLRNALMQSLSKDAIGVLITDSFGRPWRNGVVNVAIGAAGIGALHDRRGELDRDGRALEVTQVALADAVACAAGLVFGEGAEGIPAALVRGLGASAPHLPARALNRPIEEDLFR